MRARVDGSDEVLVHDAVRFHSWSVTRGIVFLVRERDADTLALQRFGDGQGVGLGRLPFRMAAYPDG
jgi:hypothetical protein